MAISFPLVCITVNAGSVNDFPYRKYIVNNGTYYALIISKKSISTCTVSNTTNIISLDNAITASGDSNSYYCTARTDNTAYVLLYDDLTGWSVHYPSMYKSSNGVIQNNYLLYTTNKSESYDTAPAGFPDIDIKSFDSILDEMDDILNATTSTTTEANKIQNNLAGSYKDYQNGNITSDQMQSNVTSARDQLNNLNSNANNTLADLIAINNGLTYADTVQDVINADNIIATQKPSANVTNTITGKTNEANKIQQQYTAGDIPQSDAVTVINQYVTQLTQLITPESTTADITAINTAISTINGIRDSIAHDSDLDQDISDSAQNSNKEEIDYLDDLTSETTASISDISADKQFNDTQKQSANNIIALVWDNEILKRLVPICAIFMVVCVTLGVKYRL